MKVYTVDAFTNRPFAGNPAGVCILDNAIDDALALKIASEINYSETAFVLKENNDSTFSLRWFTPKEEVDLCGHATLATAQILYTYNHVSKDSVIKFNTRSGLLTAKLVGNKIEMDFPSGRVVAVKSNDIINQFVQTTPVFTGENGIWYLVELADERLVRQINPDVELLLKLSHKIFVVTAKSQSEYDFVSRCFGPAVGINEDPVTGSAHCYLATYWSDKLKKSTVTGIQVSDRTGVVECELLSSERVLLRGDAVIMSELIQNW